MLAPARGEGRVSPGPSDLLRAALERVRLGPWSSGVALRLLLRNPAVRERLDPRREGGIRIGWQRSRVPQRGAEGSGGGWSGNAGAVPRDVANHVLLAYAVGVEPVVAYRIDLRFPVSCNADLERGMEALSNLGGRYKEVMNEPVPQVFAEAGKGGLVVLVLRFWTLVGSYRAMALAMKHLGRHALDEAGVMVKQPGRCLHSVREDILDQG